MPDLPPHHGTAAATEAPGVSDHTSPPSGSASLRQRNIAAVIAIIALVGLIVWGSQRSVGYVLYSPGPTINVLGKIDNHPIIKVSGHRSYHDHGGLRLVTIEPTPYGDHISLLQALEGWVDPNVNVYPYSVVYPKRTTQKSVQQQSAQEMTSSQDDAIAAAMSALHLHFSHAVEVAKVLPKTPAVGRLRSGDLIQAVDGVSTRTPDKLTATIRHVRPGTRLRLSVLRGGHLRQVAIRTAALGSKGPQAHQSHVGVLIQPSFHFPFQVKVRLPSNIGGPSAGLMFSLSIYDTLTPGSLTHGKVVAGTGEIDAQGHVSVIGGIQQKLVGAQRDGAKLFFVPAGNCAEALGGNYDPAKMRLVKVHTMADALAALKAWTKNPHAKLPRCTR